MLRETRDDPLDARVGSFLSVSLDLSPTFLGSDYQYFRTLGQVFLARPVGRSLTWAQGYRLGLANGLDEQARLQAQYFGRSTEAFRAGGANTLRGYATDSVGPPGPIRGLSRGGEALADHEPGDPLAASLGHRARGVLRRRQRLRRDLRPQEPEVPPLRRRRRPLRLAGGPAARSTSASRSTSAPSDRSFQWFFSLGQAF